MLILLTSKIKWVDIDSRWVFISFFCFEVYTGHSFINKIQQVEYIQISQISQEQTSTARRVIIIID